MIAHPPRRLSLSRLFIALAILLGVTAAMVTFRERLDKAHIVLLYLLTILGASASEGRRIGLAVSAVAFVLFDLLFLPPYDTLVIADPLDWLVLFSFVTTSIVAAELLDRQRRQAELARTRAHELDQLATLGAETLNAARADQALTAIADVIREAADVERCELFAWDAEHQIAQPIAVSGGSAALAAVVPSAPNLLNYVVEAHRTAVEWDDGTIHVLDDAARDERLRTGRTRALAIPLTARGRTAGVLRVSSTEPFTFSAERWRIVTALAYYAALGIERSRLERTEETAEALRRADRLKDALLAAVSHDLRTPLTTIKALAHEIAHEGQLRAATIEEEADRLTSLVEGLLELSQLGSGAVPLRTEVNTVDDLIGAALRRAAAVLTDRRVDVDLDEGELLLGHFDFGQTLRIVVNLLENAAKYSPRTSAIRVRARRAGEWLEIGVIDQGAGIPPSERERIFQPFYRLPGRQPDVRGAGLGLSIARGLARAQRGDLLVSGNDDGGSTFTLRLPAEDLPPR